MRFKKSATTQQAQHNQKTGTKNRRQSERQDDWHRRTKDKHKKPKTSTKNKR